MVPYCAGLLIGSGKKSNFAGFLGANSQKNQLILRHFRGNAWGRLHRKSIGKKADFEVIFEGKLCQISIGFALIRTAFLTFF